jgi:hypothetical protein
LDSFITAEDTENAKGAVEPKATRKVHRKVEAQRLENVRYHLEELVMVA